MTISLLIPMAGKGTRLRPWTDRTPKELLPLGGRPVVHGAMLDAVAAGVRDVVVVLGPKKDALREWLVANRPANVALGFALQPEPTGILDAIARGRALLGPGAFAVLYPDWISLPDQTGLRALVDAHARLGGSVIGLVRRTALHGTTARAVTPDTGDVRRVVRLEAGAGEIHTAFAEVRGQDLRLPARDEDNLDAWNEAAGAGTLSGVFFGDALDVGTIAGYEDAMLRFDEGRARWR